MECECNNLPDVFDGHAYDVERINQMPRIEKEFKCKFHGYYLIHRKCPCCGQVWRATKSKQVTPYLYFKLPAGVKIEEFDDAELRIKFVLETHGGHGNQKCMWAKCERLSLSDMKFCEYHAYYGMGITS